MRPVLPDSLVSLGAVDAVEANAFGLVVVQDFESIAVENGHGGTGEVSCESRNRP
jgi:hypothetical protein